MPTSETLEMSQIAKIAYGAGFRGEDLAIAVAVAMAESGGRPGINNAGMNSNGSVDYGLWQINSIHRPDLNMIYDPVYNAERAFKIWKDAGGWSPWVAYDNGNYEKYLEQARGAIGEFQASLAPAPTSAAQPQYLFGEARRANGRQIAFGMMNAMGQASRLTARQRMKAERAQSVTATLSRDNEEEADPHGDLLTRVNAAVAGLTPEVVEQMQMVSEDALYGMDGQDWFSDDSFDKPSSLAWGGYDNGKIPNSALRALQSASGHFLHPGASAAFDAMFDAAAADGVQLTLTDSYRSYASQVDLYGRKPHLAAKPGTSYHGWGLAIDVASAEARQWIQQNGEKFGWYWPEWARPGGSRPEDWHFEWWAVQGWEG